MILWPGQKIKTLFCFIIKTTAQWYQALSVNNFIKLVVKLKEYDVLTIHKQIF
jgi:hypothetical protein